MNKKKISQNLGTIYKNTTLLEGTIHLIRGAWKMFKTFIISIYWRHNIDKCGKGLTVYPKTQIHFPKNIRAGNNVQIEEGAFIRSENPKAKLVIGNNVRIGVNCMVDFSGNLKIEDDVLLSENSRIHTHEHGDNPYGPATFFPMKIGKNVWVAENALILSRVSKIEENAIIGARAVVVKDVPAGAVVAGNPAKTIRKKRIKK